MCRAPKSREGDHFAAAIGLRSRLKASRRSSPILQIDMHTVEGKRWGVASIISERKARS